MLTRSRKIIALTRCVRVRLVSKKLKPDSFYSSAVRLNVVVVVCDGISTDVDPLHKQEVSICTEDIVAVL